MTESENVATFVQLCKKLAEADIRHPERQDADIRQVIRLAGEVIRQQQSTLTRLIAAAGVTASRISELEKKVKELEDRPGRAG